MNDIPPIFKRKTYEGFMTQDLSRLRNNLQVSTKRSCSTILIKFFYQKITPNQKDLLKKIWSSFFFFKRLHQTKKIFVKKFDQVFSSWKDYSKRILRWRRWTWTRLGLRTATSATRSSRFTPHIRYLQYQRLLFWVNFGTFRSTSTFFITIVMIVNYRETTRTSSVLTRRAERSLLSSRWSSVRADLGGPSMRSSLSSLFRWWRWWWHWRWWWQGRSWWWRWVKDSPPPEDCMPSRYSWGGEYLV